MRGDHVGKDRFTAFSGNTARDAGSARPRGSHQLRRGGVRSLALAFPPLPFLTVTSSCSPPPHRPGPGGLDFAFRPSSEATVSVVIPSGHFLLSSALQVCVIWTGTLPCLFIYCEHSYCLKPVPLNLDPPGLPSVAVHSWRTVLSSAVDRMCRGSKAHASQVPERRSCPEDGAGHTGGSAASPPSLSPNPAYSGLLELQVLLSKQGCRLVGSCHCS